MKKMPRTFLWLVFVMSMLLQSGLAASVDYDAQIPQLAFAAQELNDALRETGREDLQVALIVKPEESSPEVYQIQSFEPSKVLIIGGDATGTMYGGLEVADLLRLGLPIKSHKRTPFVKKRGIKFNIPLDARTPSYDDTGDNAQKNIETVWDFEFWKAYLDDLARYRYNVLSLWTTHPYPSIIQMEDYPEVALDDVYRVSDGVFQPHFKNRLQDVDLDKPGTMTLVKKISIEEKIKHWQRVFQYAEGRGIEIYLFHWNVMTFGATGKYGITPDQTNPITNDYMRKCVRQALLTYPNIKGIGVTAGENADNHLEGEYAIENFLFNTYGRGIMEVLELQPERKVRFIFRQHMSGLGPITAAFADFPDEFNTSFKYAIGHMYTMRKSLLFDRGFRNEVEEYKVPCWLNLRNDDIFVHRWGNPDYVRDYIQQMPHDVMPGFYMGS
ncbi:carbohydrate-binding family 6 protein, partial [Planctomycetota bacterium]